MTGARHAAARPLRAPLATVARILAQLRAALGGQLGLPLIEHAVGEGVLPGGVGELGLLG